MIHVGHTVPGIRVPALIEGGLTYLEFPPPGGLWSALCFPATMGLIESIFLDRQIEEFGREDTTLFAVVPHARGFLDSWYGQVGKLRVRLMTDPLRRLRKVYGLTPADPYGRCQSLLIDPNGALRFRLTHDLNGRGLSALREIIHASRQPVTSPILTSSTR